MSAQRPRRTRMQLGRVRQPPCYGRNRLVDAIENLQVPNATPASPAETRSALSFMGPLAGRLLPPSPR